MKRIAQGKNLMHYGHSASSDQFWDVEFSFAALLLKMLLKHCPDEYVKAW